jgi:hypothetical protein
MTAEIARTAWDVVIGLLVWGALCAFAGWAIGYGQGLTTRGPGDRRDGQR